MTKKRLEALVILFSLLGCSKEDQIRDNDEIVRKDYNYYRNLNYLRNLVNKEDKIRSDNISEIEKRKIAHQYTKTKIRGCYYNFKSWTKNVMDDISKCIWG